MEAEAVAGGFKGFAVGLGALEDFEGPKDCAIWSSKWTIGFLERLDLRSVGSAMMIKLNSINLMNSSNLWAPRNAKALKGPIPASEGIGVGGGYIFRDVPTCYRSSVPARLYALKHALGIDAGGEACIANC